MFKQAIGFIVLFACVACCPQPNIQVVEITRVVEVTREVTRVVTAPPSLPQGVPSQQPTPSGSTPARTRSPTQTSGTQSPGVINWDEARCCVGQVKTVCGPVVSTEFATKSAGQPTFLNLGRKYPDPSRFSVVIWGRNRGNFSAAPEDLYSGKTICATGMIKEYSGALEMEVTSTSSISVR